LAPADATISLVTTRADAMDIARAVGHRSKAIWVTMDTEPRLDCGPKALRGVPPEGCLIWLASAHDTNARVSRTCNAVRADIEP
jgi:hypothetical protein